MQAEYSAQEILQMALNIEEDGVRFYKQAAEDTFDPKIKELFLQLACDEETHKGAIRQMADELDLTVQQYEDEDAFTYMTWLVHGRVFPDDGGKPVHSSRQLIYQAIEREKSTLLLYYNMKDGVGQVASDTLTKLIGEEKQHVIKLSQMLKTLS